MKIKSTHVILGIVFIFLSALIYFIHYVIFHDAHHIFLYLVGDIAFLPIEVLLVSFVFHKVIDDREKKTRLKKLNMVIGVFFTEAGTKLLDMFSNYDPDLINIKNQLIVKSQWTANDFKKTAEKLKTHDYSMQIDGEDLGVFKTYLISRREFLLKLLENPILIEHEKFTDLLMAVFHLGEELSSRRALQNIKGNDLKHINIDMERAYKLLFFEWLTYMEHLKNVYPYLFSFALRTNPFDSEAEVEFKG